MKKENGETITTFFVRSVVKHNTLNHWYSTSPHTFNDAIFSTTKRGHDN